ncbi:MAG: carbohydrate kinase, partial [Clostridiales bacterium]|nr:carbohydrate kinase [Clostridiales bacterium]
IGNIVAKVSIRSIGVTGTADARQIHEAYAAWQPAYPV